MTSPTLWSRPLACSRAVKQAYACLYASGNPALLLECANRFSPLIEQTSADAVIFDVEGMGRLYATPGQLAEAIVAQAGIPVSVGIASNPDAAWHAARGFSGITVIPPGEEAKVLAPLPLNLLGGSPQTAETLYLWGIRTFGEFAALPPMGVAARLGKEGVDLQRLARGEGYRRLRLLEDELHFEDEVELDDPVDLLEPLSFIMSRLLNDLCARLSARSLATTEIRLRLTLEIAPANGAPVHEATLRLPVPMRDPKAFLKMLQLELGSRPPCAPVEKVRLALEPVRPRTEQHGLFIPLSPEPEKLELTLARIRSLVGEDKAGTPEILDTHRPDSFRIVALGHGPLSPAAPRTHMALRRFRPPQFAQVRLQGGRPVHVASMNMASLSRGCPVLSCAGPWRTAGEWWKPDPWAHDEWDVALGDGGVFRLHRELPTERWFFECRYD
jgi:protein ImuB